MKILKIIFFSFLIFTLILIIDLISYQVFNNNIYKKFNNFKYLSSYYSDEELDKKLPFRHKLHGGECISHGLTKEKMNWHPRIGAQDKQVNVECVNKLFKNTSTNFVFFGGSVMANHITPNYKTSIEYYIFKKDLNKFRSINLAESGARMSNNLSSFIEYIPKIKNVNYAIFLDGYNEILPLRYGDFHDYDFYWVAGVNERIHNPHLFLLHKFLNKSFIFNSFFKKKIESFEKYKIKKSFEDYKYRKQIIIKLCKNYNIKCLFFFQPTLYNSKNIFGERADIIKKIFLEDEIKFGYHYLYKLAMQDDTIIKLDKIFDNIPNVYRDDVHLDKNGNKILANYISKYLTIQK